MQPFQSVQSKDFFREKSKKIRLELSDKSEFISKNVVKNISKLDIFKQAQNVMLFYPTSCEISLLGLLDFDKNFYLPKCFGKDILVCHYKKGDKLEKSKYKILEPTCEPIKDLSILDIIFVPALCADKENNRLGHGCGFYDRFLKKPGIRAKKIAVVAQELFFEKIPADSFDVKCDFVVTEKN